MPEDPADTRAANEPDALEEVARQVRGAAAAIPAVAAAAPKPGAAKAARAPVGAAAASGGGVSVTGSAPNILSKQARHRLVMDSQRAAWFLLVSAVAITAIVCVVTLFQDDSSISGWWVAAVASLSLAGVTLWLVSYLTVMGFGNVSLSMNTPDAGDGKP